MSAAFDPEQRLVDAALRARDRFRRVLDVEYLGAEEGGEPVVMVAEEQSRMLFSGMDVDARMLYRLARAQTQRLSEVIVAAGAVDLDAAFLGLMVEGILLGFELGVDRE